MQRNRIIYLLGIVVILLSLSLFVSCLTPPATAATATAQPSAITTLTERVNLVEQRMNEKAATSAITALETRMAQLEGKVNAIQSSGVGNAYSKTETYTKAEVDAAVAVAIKALKDNQTWITAATTSSSGSTTSSTPITGQVTYTTNPVAIPQIFTSTTGGQSIFYTMRILNGTNQWQYVKPVITLSIASSYSSRTVGSINISFSSGSCSMSQSFTTTSNGATPPVYSAPTYAPASPRQMSLSPDTLWQVATPSLVFMPIAGCNGTGEFQIGAGQFIDILINITGFTTSDVTLWNVSHSISSRSI